MAASRAEQSSSPEERKLELEARRVDFESEKVAIERRKLELDQTFPRKWGSVVFGAAATLVAAILSGTLGWLQTDSARTDRKAAEAVAERQRVVENDRLAVDMYFKYVASQQDPRVGTRHANLLQSLASGTKVKAFLGNAFDGQYERAARAGGEASSGPSQSLAGLPDRIRDKPIENYRMSDFVVYLQYAENGQLAAEALRTALRSLGATVPAAQLIDVARTPSRSEIRIYRADHQAVAQNLANQLKLDTGVTFAVRQIQPGTRSLPNGVMEIWIGTQDAERFFASVSVALTTTAGNAAVLIDGTPVPLRDGRGEAVLPVGPHHVLLTARGQPGATATLSLDIGNQQLAEVSLTISPGQSQAFAERAFKVLRR